MARAQRSFREGPTEAPYCVYTLRKLGTTRDTSVLGNINESLLPIDDSGLGFMQGPDR